MRKIRAKLMAPQWEPDLEWLVRLAMGGIAEFPILQAINKPPTRSLHDRPLTARPSRARSATNTNAYRRAQARSSHPGGRQDRPFPRLCPDNHSANLSQRGTTAGPEARRSNYALTASS